MLLASMGANLQRAIPPRRGGGMARWHSPSGRGERIGEENVLLPHEEAIDWEASFPGSYGAGDGWRGHSDSPTLPEMRRSDSFRVHGPNVVAYRWLTASRTD